MLVLASTSDAIQVVTGSALANTLVHASWVDLSGSTVTPGRTNTSISTATTTSVAGSPAVSTYRNVKRLVVRNTNASNQTITVQHTDGTTTIVLWSGILAQNESVVFDGDYAPTRLSANGAPIQGTPTTSLYNFSTAAQGPGFSSDTYLTGSAVQIPGQGVRVGTAYRCRFSVAKTAAGTATPIIQLRHGTNASAADTSRCSFTFSAGTAATDVGLFEVLAVFRTVGSGTAAVLQGHCAVMSQPTTGFSSLLKGVQTTSSGFDSTTAAAYLGVSVNGGASASWTVQLVQAELLNV